MPSTTTLKPSTRLPTAYRQETAIPTPPPAKRLAEETWRRFITEHRELQATLATYLASGRKGSLRLSAAVLDEIDPAAAPYLFANNMNSRIDFAAVAKRHFEALVEPVGTFYFVTLMPKKFVVAEKDAPDFDHRSIQGWVHQTLAGFSYFGIVEPAYYTNVGALLGTDEKAVSWHVHLLLWGANERDVKAKVKAINGKYTALLPGPKPASAMPVEGEEVIKCLLYMLKAPQCNYRCYQMKEDVKDPDTGEVTSRATGRFRQKKGPLRPNEMVRMCNVMEGKLMDKLTFAAGDGKAVHAAICTEALAPLRRQQAHADAIEAHRRDSRQTRDMGRHQ